MKDLQPGIRQGLPGPRPGSQSPSFLQATKAGDAGSCHRGTTQLPGHQPLPKRTLPTATNNTVRLPPYTPNAKEALLPLQQANNNKQTGKGGGGRGQEQLARAAAPTDIKLALMLGFFMALWISSTWEAMAYIP